MAQNIITIDPMREVFNASFASTFPKSERLTLYGDDTAQKVINNTNSAYFMFLYIYLKYGKKHFIKNKTPFQASSIVNPATLVDIIPNKNDLEMILILEDATGVVHELKPNAMRWVDSDMVNAIPVDDPSVSIDSKKAMIGRMELYQNMEYKNIKDEIKNYERSIKDRIQQIKDYEKNIKDMENTLKIKEKVFSKMVEVKFDPQNIDREIERIKKFPLIEDCYYSKTRFAIIVNTKTLKYHNKKLGRFQFFINSEPGRYCMEAENLDFDDGNGHRHPNISGNKICWGAHESEVKRWFEQGNFAALVDFLIVCLTTEQPDGNPYVSMHEWLSERIKVERPIVL